MFTLFSRIILSNWKSLLVLFSVMLFASTGFVTLREITTNIDSLVASKTRPLFGADLIVSPKGYATGDILPLIRPYLSGETYVAAERREFSTTLLDREGKAGLVQVVAYSGSYPQRGILEVERIIDYKGGIINSGQIEKGEQTEKIEKIEKGKQIQKIEKGEKAVLIEDPGTSSGGQERLTQTEQILPSSGGQEQGLGDRQTTGSFVPQDDGDVGKIALLPSSGGQDQSGQKSVSLRAGGVQKNEQNPPSPIVGTSFRKEINDTIEQDRVAVTQGLLDRFASGGTITLDGKRLVITEKILQSSDLGFSLGTENHLIILPSSLLSGSLLLSSGSRLDQDLLISFSDELRSQAVADRLQKVLPEEAYRVRTYADRTERNLDTVKTLTDYVTLILLISTIFAFVILRSAHESFFESLARTLRVTEILGLTRKRQRIILLMLYGIIFPLAFVLSIGFSDLIIEGIRRIPEAGEFRFFFSAVPGALLLLFLVVIMAWFSVWWTMGGQVEKADRIEKIEKVTRLNNEVRDPVISSEIGSMKIDEKSSTYSTFFRNIGMKISPKVRMTLSIGAETFIPLILGILILFLLFESPFFALAVGLGAGVFLLIFGSILRYLYGFIFRRSTSFREKRFYLYDAVRALVRPLTPTIPISIALISVTVFFLVFATFSLAFRAKLVVDTGNTANIYAINILEQDKKNVDGVIGSGALIYDILRARIAKIDGRSLEEHFAVERASGEFTREFNITTTPLENKILQGKKVIGKGEVSVDDEFARRLQVGLGDSITFLLSGREITLTIANIRESVRQGFQPFFYFSFDPIEFANAPRTYFVAEYTPDTEAWKREILAASGPHVTFIDIESILVIVRDISGKVLSVISLFFAVVFLFAIGAIIAFFSRMRGVEDMKTRLYSLFGARSPDIRTSLSGTRSLIFIVSYALSILIGGVLSYFVLTRGGFFAFSYLDYLMIAGVTGVVYGVMMVWMRR